MLNDNAFSFVALVAVRLVLATAISDWSSELYSVQSTGASTVSVRNPTEAVQRWH